MHAHGTYTLNVRRVAIPLLYDDDNALYCQHLPCDCMPLSFACKSKCNVLRCCFFICFFSAAFLLFCPTSLSLPSSQKERKKKSLRTYLVFLNIFRPLFNRLLNVLFPQKLPPLSLDWHEIIVCTLQISPNLLPFDMMIKFLTECRWLVCIWYRSFYRFIGTRSVYNTYEYRGKDIVIWAKNKKEAARPIAFQWERLFHRFSYVHYVPVSCTCMCMSFFGRQYHDFSRVFLVWG